MHMSSRKGAETGTVAVKDKDEVQILFEGIWYDAVILAVSNDGTTCQAKYEDEEEEDNIDIARRVRHAPPPIKVEQGNRMEIEWEGKWYDCEILAVGDGDEQDTCTVKYIDHGDEEEDVYIPHRIRTPRIKLHSLKVGQKFRGEVKRITGFGAFVDIGAEADGMVHIGRIARERVENIEEYLEVGQMVDVWISQISADSKLGLSMVESLIHAPGGRKAQTDLSAFKGVSSDQWLDGIVTHIANFGVFVATTPLDGSAPQQGLVHISNLRNYVVQRGTIEDEVSVGEEVKVRVVKLDERTGKMGLSMKDTGDFQGGVPRAPADLVPFEGVSPMVWLNGTVVSHAPFGIFISVTAPDGKSKARGLLHISRIVDDGVIYSTQDELEIGAEVQVRVIDVNVALGKMSLSMMEDSVY